MRPLDVGAFFVFISTDYVYDGANPPYFPDSPVNPLNAYGRMKWEAELIAEKECGADGGAVLRIPMLYGPVESLSESSVTEIATALMPSAFSDALSSSANAPFGAIRKVDHWARRYPAHVDDVSRAILLIIDAWQYGTLPRDAAMPRFLLSGMPGYTKYEMLQIMAKALEKDMSHIEPDPLPPRGAPRPRDCRMDTSRLEQLGWHQEKHFDAEIGAILRPFFNA